ncbi:MAG: adenosylcobinamide-phosphate guanylyltransferase [Paenibacillus sp.]|nr:adenosylcobinamide-phosphate guanylyltransferase [Paenibacillus sp.]
MLILVTGGARSGKSSFAELYSSRLGVRGVYIATAQAYDEEMRERIGLHQRQRDTGCYDWITQEEPYALAERLQELYNNGFADRTEPGFPRKEDGQPVILVDCLTLWLSNWLLQYEQEADAETRLQEQLERLNSVCRQFTADENKHLVMVTNEVGYGLVPEYKLGRQFRDLSGIMNQRLAREADQVFLVTAGIPVELKSIRYEL